MRIPRRLLDELIAHAIEDAPNECCGIVAARDGEAVAVHRVRNEAASPLKFVMDGKQQYDVITAIEDEGLELGAMYHSHTRSDPYPSQTDVNLAKWWPDPLWVIVGVKETDAPVVRAYRIVDGAIDEISLQVV